MIESFRKFYRSPRGSFVLLIAAAIVFRQSVSSPYKIPSGSMIPTLKIGDFLFVNKLAYALKLPIPYVNANLLDFGSPRRGDIVVFIFPGDKSVDYIKRVVGVPGDVIELRDNALYVNGAANPLRPSPDHAVVADQTGEVREYFRLSREVTGDVEHLILNNPALDGNRFDPITVPPGMIFCMGDNRDSSYDSRAWGFVPIEDVRGQAKFIWLSVDFENPYRVGGLTLPRIRWDRFGMRVI